MLRLLRRMKEPAAESRVTLALGLAAVVMGLMLWAILWQSNIISYQREIIRWLWDAKFGG